MTRAIFTSRSLGPILALLAICTAAVVALVHQPQKVQLGAFLLPALTVWYLRSKGGSDARLSWQLPLAGYASTFAIGAGISASNRDIRAESELVGVSVFVAMTVLGMTHLYKSVRALPEVKPPQWRKDAAAGLVCNLVLAWAASSLAYASYEAKHYPIPVAAISRHQSVDAPQTIKPASVWIDTDPACGDGTPVDVDDCWALLAAVRSPELAIRGISTVFGHQDGRQVHRVMEGVLARLAGGQSADPAPFRLHAGSTTRGGSAWRPTLASQALATALEQEPLTILALGPLTNIATLLRHRPDLTERIERIVLVGGKRPGQHFHPGHQWWFRFSDSNIAHDPDAARIVLYSGVPVTLVPFDLAAKLVVTEADLERLRDGDGAAKWLSEVSQPGLSFWNTLLGRPGFHPFDVLAVAYAAMPEHFRCQRIPARIGFNLFLEPLGMGRDLDVAEHLRGPMVTDCYDLDRVVKEEVLTRILGESDAAFDLSRAM